MSIPTGIFPASSSCQAIALFNADRQEEAMQRVKELANICPEADIVACHVVEVSIIGSFRLLVPIHFHQAYLLVELGIKALNVARHDEAAGHFNDAIHSGVLSNERGIYSEYEIFIIVCSYPSDEHNVFHAQLWALYSCSGGTSRPCGKLHISIGATHCFRQVS